MHPKTITNISPSFTTHSSSNNLADVAARVVEEFRQQDVDGYDDIFNSNDYVYQNNELIALENENIKDNDVSEGEFEFDIVCNNANSSSTSGDDMFLHPQYPLFDQSLLLDADPDPKPSTRLPLGKLFSEDRDFGSSSSSSDNNTNDLNGINSGTYCVWKPKKELAEKCKKSNSTGNSSRRWKFRDILYRSHSDGTESPFIFFKPLMGANKKVLSNEKVVEKAKRLKDVSNRAEPRQSYLPPGQALATAFSTVSRPNRNLHIF